jgi:hypothetical protein
MTDAGEGRPRRPSTRSALVGVAVLLAATVVAYAATRAPPFSVRATPSRFTVQQGRSATIRVRITRRRGFHHTVRLSVTRLPKGTHTTWRPARRRLSGRRRVAVLTVRVPAGARPGTYRPRITARSGHTVRRRTLRLVVVAPSTVVGAPPQSFSIAGDLAQKLYPGTSARLDLALTNPNDVDLQVTNLTVAVDARTSSPACDGTQNFAASQYSGPYPLTLPPGTSTLSRLVGDPSRLPRIAMRDLPTSQDACQNASITLHYAGSATK